MNNGTKYLMMTMTFDGFLESDLHNKIKKLCEIDKEKALLIKDKYHIDLKEQFIRFKSIINDLYGAFEKIEQNGQKLYKKLAS